MSFTPSPKTPSTAGYGQKAIDPSRRKKDNGSDEARWMSIYVDADGCPVKDEVFKVARRYKLKVYVVSNSRIRVPAHELFESVVVAGRFDAADDWITERAGEADVVVTSDVLLAARCVERKSLVLDPKGRVFTENSIGNAVANRELAGYLRDMGEMGGGPAPFRRRDREMFLQRLDDLIQAAMRSLRSAGGIT